MDPRHALATDSPDLKLSKSLLAPDQGSEGENIQIRVLLMGDLMTVTERCRLADMRIKELISAQNNTLILLTYMASAS